MNDINPQEFGRLQSEVEGLRRDTNNQTVMLQTLVSEMSAMRTQMAEAKGGWRVLMFLGGSAGALGAGLATWVNQLLHGPKP
jgi:uncharacterized SAM-dependent methyltransferase